MGESALIRIEPIEPYSETEDWLGDTLEALRSVPSVAAVVVQPATGDKRLFKFRWRMRRSADIVGTFIATQTEVDKAIGLTVYFGEIAKKHSEVQGTLDAKDLTVLCDDVEAIILLERLGLGETGWNPLEYANCAGCGYNPQDGCDCE